MKDKKELFEYVSVKFYINITFTKLVGTAMIGVGIKLNNMELVKYGVYVLIGRKIGSAIINNKKLKQKWKVQ